MVRRVSLIIACCLAALFVAHTDAAGAVDLQYKFTPGEVVRHKVVMDVDLALAANVPNARQLPPMHMKMVAIMKQKTARVLPDGQAEVVDTPESATVTMGNETKKIPLDKFPPITGMVSIYGPSAISAVPGQGGGLLSGLQMGSGGLTQYMALPGQPLNVGDYWTDTASLPIGVKMQQRSKLAAEKSKLGNYDVAVVKQDLSGSMDIPFSRLAALLGQVSPTNARVQIDGNLKGMVIGDGTTYFSVERGRAIRSDGTVDLQMDANMRDNGQAMQVAIRAHINYAINLIPPK